MQFAGPMRLLPLDQRPRILRLGIGRVPLPGPEWMRFDLEDYWSLHLYQYHGELKTGDAHYMLRPGGITIAPPHTPLLYKLPRQPSEHIYVLFRMPQRTRRRASIPAYFEPGPAFKLLYSSLTEAIGRFPLDPLWTEVRFWDVLLELAWRFGARSEGQPGHPAVREAQQLIELGLSGKIRVPNIAKQVGLSQNHLIRLFNAQFGTSVMGYIRRRRIDHARQLLTRSNLPIKAIAAEVGIPDPHLFNKTIRRELGLSPRSVRKNGVRR